MQLIPAQPGWVAYGLSGEHQYCSWPVIAWACGLRIPVHAVAMTSEGMAIHLDPSLSDCPRFRLSYEPPVTGA